MMLDLKTQRLFRSTADRTAPAAAAPASTRPRAGSAQA